MIELTDADRAAILEASGYLETTVAGDKLFSGVYRAGLAAGIERALQVVAVDILGGTANEHLAVVAFRDERIAAIRAML
jgi:hypothetical protein